MCTEECLFWRMLVFKEECVLLVFGEEILGFA